jgi:beta-phosphoglucomutase-like phosphatase (HAD superfamily)
MDGVLVNTEPLYIKMNKDFLSQYNSVITDEEYNQFIGISAKKMWDYLQEKYNLPFSVDELIAIEKQAKYTILNETELQPTDGIVDLLDRIKATKCIK